MPDGKPSNQFTIHPAADAFRMMTFDELEVLAADIKANGLVEPIMLDSTGKVLVDGRNRLKACEMAGVEPRFERLNGVDPRAYVVAKNIARRNITKGQAALALALIYPEPKRGIHADPELKLLTQKLRIWKAQLSQARTIVAHADLVIEVRSGAMHFEPALTEARKRENSANGAEARLTKLRSTAPDLADLVDEQRLTLDDAEGALTERQNKEKRAIDNGRRAAAELADGLVARVTEVIAAIQLGDAQAIRERLSAERIDKLHKSLDMLSEMLNGEAGDER